MNYFMTQAVTGYGCFKAFKIAKLPNAACDFCGEGNDSNIHMLMECAAWSPDAMTIELSGDNNWRSR